MRCIIVKPATCACSVSVPVWTTNGLQSEEVLRLTDAACMKPTGKNRMMLQGCGDAPYPACGGHAG